ncbi:MAG: NADH-quinone oxidoreductase subunit NuoG [Nitrospirales bacterium]|nr:NADH-quinone oxidoreductase subunit NuoG [Nitrospirales bacterium]
MAESNNQDLVTLTVDGMTTSVPQGTLVIEAARQVGVMIPHFCYHPKLTPDANCRMCLVEIEKLPRLQTSCSTKVAEGMVVKSNVPHVDEARKSVLEFILANHPLDCPVCDQGGRCDLQDFSHQYTPTTSRFTELKRVFPKEYFSPLIETQMNRCVQCMRCVRYCDQVMDVKALAPSGRGTLTEIKHFSAHELDCEFCGGCVQICPVGAITSRLSMYDFRPWMLKRTDTICTYCGDGCHITIQKKQDELIEVNSTQGVGRNNGDLCARGFFGYHASVHPDRIMHPLIKQQDGRFAQATWEEALELVAEKFQGIKTAFGGNAFGGLVTSRCTNEELYLFQKFMRGVLGSNRVDSSARFGHVNGTLPLLSVQGTHRWTATFEDIVDADALLLIGTNITETNPITGLKVKQAVKQGHAILVTMESLLPARGTISNITLLATHHLPVRPDHYHIAIVGLIKSVLDNGLVDPGLETRAPEFFRAIKAAIDSTSWAHIEEVSGVSREVFSQSAHAFSSSTRGMIIVGQGVLRSPRGAEMVTNLLDFLILTGRHGQPGCGLCPLAEENNDQGAIEMGATAEFLPGPIAIGHHDTRQALSKLWEVDLPQEPASSLMEMFRDAQAGQVKAMYIVGENPVESLPQTGKIKEALESLEFLVCQELFLTETAQLADVVLPACSYVEKDGTFTNTEGMVQPVRQAIDPIGESRPDWEIFSALSVVMDQPMEYGEARDIFKEIRSVIPGYGLVGPVATRPTPKVDVVQQYLQEGFAHGLATRYVCTQDQPASDTPFLLASTQSLFHSGKFSTRSKGLLQIQSSGAIMLNPSDAKKLGIASGDSVCVSNAHGAVTTIARVLNRIPPDVACFPEHFDQDIRCLFELHIDKESHVPYSKLTWVRLERVEKGDV